MATLNSWQKISRVLSSDFGDGSSGSATISSDPNTRATFTGTATQTTGTAGDSSIATGSLVMIHQTQGTNAGQWEINYVTSGGSTSLTFKTALYYTYGAGAQIIVIPRYTTATINTHSITSFDGSLKGIEVICANTSVTFSGNLSGVGSTGGYGTSNGSTVVGGGFRGGARMFGNPVTGYSGDGHSGDTAQQTGARGNGGGGAYNGSGFAGGGGGGYTNNGGNGGGSSYGGTGGTGGSSCGAADLTTIFLGGGGGGATRDSGSQNAENGASGGGAIIVFSKEIIASSYGAIVNGGSNTLSGGFSAGGGGGAGGSILFVCNTTNIGTNKLTATGGSGGPGDAGASGGAGSVGRIAIHYKTSVTGTSNPSYTGVQDTSLKEGGGTNFFAFF